MYEQLFLKGTGETHEEHLARAIKILQTFEPKEGYEGAFSGGKDSCALKGMAKKAGVKVRWAYRVTTIDPPELIYFIKEFHPDVKFERPDKPLWARIPEKKMPPNRLVRWCCREYKHPKAHGRALVGVRASESPRRAKNWKHVMVMKDGGQQHDVVAPLLLWSDENVWRFIREEGLPYCKLYDEPNVTRLGCVMCPLGRPGNEWEEARWPMIARLWKKGIYLSYERNKEHFAKREGNNFTSGEALWQWWLSNGKSVKKSDDDECQGLGLFTDGDD